MDKEKFLEIYRVKVCPVCKSFQECNESKRYGVEQFAEIYEDFEVKVFEVKGEEKVFEYSCKSFACNDLGKSFCAKQFE